MVVVGADCVGGVTACAWPWHWVRTPHQVGLYPAPRNLLCPDHNNSQLFCLSLGTQTRINSFLGYNPGRLAANLAQCPSYCSVAKNVHRVKGYGQEMAEQGVTAGVGAGGPRWGGPSEGGLGRGLGGCGPGLGTPEERGGQGGEWGKWARRLAKLFVHTLVSSWGMAGTQVHDVA